MNGWRLNESHLTLICFGIRYEKECSALWWLRWQLCAPLHTSITRLPVVAVRRTISNTIVS